MAKKQKIDTFLNDPEVGKLYWKDALEKYKGMTADEMLFLLSCECGERIYPNGPDRFRVVESLPNGKQKVEINTDVTMYRIYHTLQVIRDKLKEENKEG